MMTQGIEFVSKIKETRIKHGLTIKQVSDLTGIPYRTLQNWEAGVRKCPDYVTNFTVEFLKNCLLLDDPEKYKQLYE
jgi:transcriptional regulator with XRE-family HTH domain